MFILFFLFDIFICFFFFFQAEDGIRDHCVTGVQTCALPIFGGFEPLDEVTLPDGAAYLMVDLETGADTRNVTPDAALETINRRGRSPLTVDEGVALLTHHPEAVARNAGFSLLGSRCGDRRVTAMWISKGHPKLGWCWAGNPHTWLGSASCAGRLESRWAQGLDEACSAHSGEPSPKAVTSTRRAPPWSRCSQR